MKTRLVVVLALTLLTTGVAAQAQTTPPAMVQAYEQLADTILAVRGAEAGLVKALLDGHRHAAEVLAGKGDWQAAAAQIALFANEGDNAVGGVRKRLLEGGHHFNATGEEQGIYEPGYVIVTREAKAELLEISSLLRRGEEGTDPAKAFASFLSIADSLLSGE